MGSHEGLWKGEGQQTNNGDLGSAVERGQRKHGAGREPAEAQAALPGGGQRSEDRGSGSQKKERCDLCPVPHISNKFCHLRFICGKK